MQTSDKWENSLESLILEKKKSGPRVVLSARREAAVLLPLIQTPKGCELLFEVRSPGIVQGGEICFPGGSVEENETPEEAAARETREELLLARENVSVLAPLHVIQGPGGRKVTSFLGLLSDYQDTFSRDEVARILRIPIRELRKAEPETAQAFVTPRPPENFPFEKIPGGRSYPWQSVPRTYYFYDTPEGTIWGMTAELLYLFLSDLRGV
ncbi:MAG: NUDIX hydrolase [Lachnospiraceae bacterium]